MDVALQKKEWRGSQHSLASHHSVDRGTQTDEDDTKSIKTPDSPRKDYTKKTSSPMRETQLVESPKSSPKLNGIPEHRYSIESSRNGEDSMDEFSDVESDVEIHTAEAAVARPKAGVVSVPKRLPPALPPRNPGRISSGTLPRSTTETLTQETFDQISLTEEHTEETKADEKHDDEIINLNGPTTPAGLTHVTEDDFHSVPPSPLVEKRHSEVPGSFN